MRNWQLSSVRRILSYAPERVVKIGSETGLMLFSIAPYCSYYYYVTDASVQAIEFPRHLGSLMHVVSNWRWELRDALIDAAPVKQAEIMQGMGRETVIGILEFASPDIVDLEMPWQDIGIDSLTAVLLRNRLATLASLGLPAMVRIQSSKYESTQPVPVLPGLIS
ncbi:hypothetical protein F5Y14DRAFT_455434 [Nemania sp. NC0429]|nr:hypothetical protein F5Y14DRAFT_455434 [Nemania sp. NC0429]